MAEWGRAAGGDWGGLEEVDCGEKQAWAIE